MRIRATVAFALALATITLGGLVGAQPKTQNAAAAQALFDDGVRLMKAGDWKAACPKFDASMKLDASVGTQVNIARCAQQDGLTATAWAEFKKAKVLNQETPGAQRKKDMEGYIDQQIADLQAKLPYMTVRVTPRPEGLRVERDRASVPVEGLDQRVPIDPGKHTIVVSAPGFRAVTREVTLADGGDQTVEITLEADPNAVVPPVGPNDPTTPPIVRPQPEQPKKDEGMNVLVVAGAVIGGVGAATLAISGITGGIAYGDKGTVDQLVEDEECGLSSDDSTISCSSDSARTEAHDAISRGESLALASTVTLFVGAAVAATGLTLIIVGATKSEPAPPPVTALFFATPKGAWGGVGGRF